MFMDDKSCSLKNSHLCIEWLYKERFPDKWELDIWVKTKMSDYMISHTHYL